MALRFGLTTPIVTLAPRSHAAWEEQAGPTELLRIAESADRLGYHHLTCSEHIAIPRDVVEVRGGCYYDPLSTLGFLAARTSRIRLASHVAVLPYHHPLELAKRYGTLDRLSGGRVVLGVGVGSLREEFALLGVDFTGRGDRYEDALRALRAALGRREPQYHGRHFDFAGYVVEPAAAQAELPIWIGGRSARSLRRALVFGDGWVPFGLSLEELRVMLERARGSREWTDRARPFEVVLSPERTFDVTEAGARREQADLIERYREIGASVLSLRFRHRSLEHCLEQLDAFAADVVGHWEA